MMHDVLQPLTLQPGVKQAAVISADGVPVCVLERSSFTSGEFVDCTNSSQPALEGQRIDPASLVALAASWVDDVMRAGGQIAWELPKRFVLCASQATLVVQRGPNAHVMVVVEPGIAPETFSMPLEAAVERLNRLLRDLGRFDPEQNASALPRGAEAAEPAASAPAFTAPSLDDYARAGQGGAHAAPHTPQAAPLPAHAPTTPPQPGPEPGAHLGGAPFHGTQPPTTGHEPSAPFDVTGDH